MNKAKATNQHLHNVLFFFFFLNLFIKIIKTSWICGNYLGIDNYDYPSFYVSSVFCLPFFCIFSFSPLLQYSSLQSTFLFKYYTIVFSAVKNE